MKSFGSPRIYLDYASLTPIDGRVMREMKKYSGRKYANPSSLYREGVAAKNALRLGRKTVAGFLGAHEDEIVFVGGGTEANGLAIEGAGRAAHRAGFEKPHLIISAIEHSSIMETANMLEKHGCEVTRLSVDASGLISLDELKKAIRPETFLISIMMVNNETGTIQDIHEAIKIVRRARSLRKDDSRYPLFHTDAAQAMYENLNMEKLGVDLLTLDSGKMYGPRGIGALYVRRGTPIEQIIYGGGQERGLRSGTENISSIMGFAKAIEIILQSGSVARERECERLSELKQIFVKGLRAIRSDIVVHGETTTDATRISPHILNVSFQNISDFDNEFFVLQLDVAGIACSTKSSCLRDEDESYVLKAMGVDSKTSVRFSLGRSTSKKDIQKALKIIDRIVQKSL